MASPVSQLWSRLAPAARKAQLAALDVVSPRRAALARHWDRLERDGDYRDAVLTLLRARGYKSAKSHASQTPWVHTGGRSADGEVLHDLWQLRARSRELGRDDPIGAGLMRTFVDGIVGHGLKARAALGDDASEREDAVDEAWTRVRDCLAPAENCGWGELQRLIANRLVEDGEVFVKRSSMGADPIFFEIVEADRVDTPMDSLPADPEGQIRHGIERDRVGRVVAFWVSKKHPGDVVLHKTTGRPVTVPTLSKVDYDRIPAEDIRHIKLTTRPGQSRGVPILHAVLQDIRDLDLLLLASLKRVQVSACFAAFIETVESVPDLFNATAEKYHYQLDQDLVPGMMFALAPGEKIQTINPNFPLPDLDVFVRLLARRIGAGCGLPGAIVLSSFEDSNYSSARADLLAAEETYATLRLQVIRALDWIRSSALEDAILRGDLSADPADVEEGRATWIAPAKRWVDPEKEAKAALVLQQLGYLTLQDFAAERGKDWEDVLRQQAKEQALRDELGLSVTPEEPEQDETAQDTDDPQAVAA